MKLLTGLFLAAKRRLMTRDSGADEFKSKIDELVSRKDELTAENVASRVEELKKLTDDIPDGDDKAKLVRFLEDFKAVKEYSPEVAKEAADDVSKLYESLCADALKDAPDANANADGGENGEPNGGKANDDDAAKKAAEATVAPDGDGKPKDADGGENGGKEGENADKSAGTSDDDGVNEEYEKIYQYCKKRAEQDAANGTTDDDGADKNADDKGDEDNAGDDGKGKDDGGSVSDHAPRIPVNLGGSKNRGGLSDLFNMAKGGR